MKIDDLPRPWLLAAMTGVPISVLLDHAEEELRAAPTTAWQTALRDEYGRRRADRSALEPAVRVIRSRRLDS